MMEKMITDIALFVQGLLKDRPMKYSDVRSEVMKKYGLTKTKAGNILSILARRKHFLYLAFRYTMTKESILYLPEHRIEALKMFKFIRESIPFKIWYTNKKAHKILLNEARKIALQNRGIPPKLLVEIIKWKLKVHYNTAKRLLIELG